MINQILSILKISALALVLSIGLSYAFAAWAPPTELPPDGNADAPINVGATPQTKAGGLTVGSLVTGTLRVTTGAGAARVLTSDASGNATWQAPTGGSALPSGVAGQTLRNVGGTSWATSSLLFNTGTNIGIGTTVPTRKFEVTGGPALFNSGIVSASKNDAGVIASGSGFFEASAPVNYYSGASSWQHLIESRHTNDTNNYALQIAGSFFDQNLYFRKTNNSATTAWNKFVMEDSSGSVGIGTVTPTGKLDVNGNIRQTVTHGNNMGLVMPAANNGGGTGQVGLYSWISEPAATWTGGGIARNMINSNASFPRINTGLSGQMMHFTEAGNIEFTTETGAGVRINPLILSSAGTATIYRDASINGVTVGRGAGNLSSNTAVGFQALSGTGAWNTAVGSSALAGNTTGRQNIAVGFEALRANTSGNNNIAIGPSALFFNNGGQNTAIGLNALINNTSGGYNTAVGFASGLTNTTGTYNTLIGYTANVANNTIWNGTAIGHGATVAASNYVRIGNTSVTQIGGQVGWSALSDARQKENVADYAHGLDFITKLRPVTFTMKDDTTKVLHSGFIAQEVEATGVPFYGLNKPANEKDFYSLSYAEFVVPLVNSVKELKAENDTLSEKVNKLQAENDALLSRVEKIEEKLK